MNCCNGASACDTTTHAGTRLPIVYDGVTTQSHPWASSAHERFRSDCPSVVAGVRALGSANLNLEPHRHLGKTPVMGEAT